MNTRQHAGASLLLAALLIACISACDRNQASDSVAAVKPTPERIEIETPQPTQTGTPAVTPESTASPSPSPKPGPSPTAVPTGTSLPTTTPTTLVTPTPSPLSSPTPIHTLEVAEYRIENIVTQFIGGGQGLVKTKFLVMIANESEVPGTEPVELELVVDDRDRETVGLAGLLAEGQTDSLELSRDLAPGLHHLKFIFSDSEISLDVHVKAADVSVSMEEQAVNAGGDALLDVQVTNAGDLTAESVKLSARWEPLTMDPAEKSESSGSIDTAAVVAAVKPGESRGVAVRLPIAAGAYRLAIGAETDGVEAFLDNNSASRSVFVVNEALNVEVETIRHVGYRQNGDGLVEILLSVDNRGASDSGGLIGGVLCVDGGCLDSLSLDSLEAGKSMQANLSVPLKPGVTDVVVFAGSLGDGHNWDKYNVSRVAINVPERFTPNPALSDETVAIAGYWSDGTANVEITPRLGALTDGEFHGISIKCNSVGETLNPCPVPTATWPTVGDEPAVESYIMRLPMRESYALEFDYGGESSTVEVHVPERILGVEREVWDCFSDTSNVGTAWESTLGVGCAGWYVDTITKWDNKVPVRLWVNPAAGEKHIGKLDEMLARLTPMLRLDIERVDSIYDANFVAHPGVYYKEVDKLDTSCFPGCVGSWPIDDGVIRSGRIAVYFYDSDESSVFERELLKDTLFSLLQVRRRHVDQTSVLGHFEVVDPAYPHRMDEALIRLLYHPLVLPGMTMQEVRSLLILRDELLDSPEPEPLTPLEVLEEAHERLQAANSAAFAISASRGDCDGEFEFSDYRIANFHLYGPRWVQLSNGEDSYIILEHDYNIDYPYTQDPPAEIWAERFGQWLLLNQSERNEREFLRRYRELSPHHALTSIFRGLDKVRVEVVSHSDGQLAISARIDAQAPYYPSAEIAVVIDEHTYEIREYAVSLPDADCSFLDVKAANGRYGVALEVPESIIPTSRYLSSCMPESLGTISGTLKRKGVLPGSCGPDPTRNARRYHFTIPPPASVVSVFAHRHYITLRLLRGDETIGGDAGTWHGPYRDDSWEGAVLPAGEYAIEVGSFHPLVSLDFEIEISVTPFEHSPVTVSSGYAYTCTLDSVGSPFCWGKDHLGQASPPLRDQFESISSGPFHSCALDADGTVTCWGNDDYGQATPPADHRFTAISSGGWNHSCALSEGGTPVCWGSQSAPSIDGKFTAISSGNFHSCALREDGLPICWGNGKSGQASPREGEKFAEIESGGYHTCALSHDGTAVCWGMNKHGQSSPPEGETFTAISSGERHTCALRLDGTAVCWGDDVYGQSSPPEGESFTTISSGHGHTSHTCGVTTGGRVLCWGWGQ